MSHRYAVKWLLSVCAAHQRGSCELIFRVGCTQGQSSHLRSLVSCGATVVVAADTHAQQQIMHDSEAPWKVGQTVMVTFEGADHISGLWVGKVRHPHTHTHTHASVCVSR